MLNLTCYSIFYKIFNFGSFGSPYYALLRPNADQSSKAAFGKSSFAKTSSNVLSFVIDMTGAHQSSKKQKYFRARFGTSNEQNAFC